MQNTNISNIVISISSICQNNGGVEGGGWSVSCIPQGLNEQHGVQMLF